MKMILKNKFEAGLHKVAVYKHMENGSMERVLTLDASAGGKDCKAMEVAGLEPANDNDVFTYANHLLGHQFDSFEYHHLESEEDKRINKMVELWNEEGRAFSNVANDDGEFFKLIGMSSERVGTTSQTGNDVLYYHTELYAGADNALKKRANANRRMYNGCVTETIDCTPTWQGILPLHIAILEQGKGGVKESKLELKNMAKTADAALEMVKVLDEVDTALAVLAIGRDHGITPQAEKALADVTPKIQALIEAYKPKKG